MQKTTGVDGRDRPASEEQAEQQRQEIRETIKENPEMNNHQIAQDLKVSDHTVMANTDKFASGQSDQLQKQRASMTEIVQQRKSKPNSSGRRPGKLMNRRNKNV